MADFALPQGSPAPTIDQTGFVSVTTGTPGFLQVDANSFSYVFTGLTPETNYSFYIRGNCDPFISNPVGPRNVPTPPSCYKPSAQTATILAPFDPAVSPFTATLGWTNNVNSPVTEWQISIQATGSPAPAVTQIGTTVTANPYLATGLTPNTCYDYYVRSVCGGVNGLSTWTGPFNFCTPPTCPQPINLGSTNPNEPTANLFWTEAGTATQWEYIFQPPIGPVPGSTTSGTITNESACGVNSKYRYFSTWFL
ncbi:MAG: fibronectin type III domain-containing protein [Flavobacterium sp.]|nr:fibronectin type III domain-containing protein [Flavobacterium sp.]